MLNRKIKNGENSRCKRISNKILFKDYFKDDFYAKYNPGMVKVKSKEELSSQAQWSPPIGIGFIIKLMKGGINQNGN